MKQIEVQIMQQSYMLSCPEGRELHLLEAVERIDGAMTRIRDAGKVRTRERIAVLPKSRRPKTKPQESKLSKSALPPPC